MDVPRAPLCFQVRKGGTGNPQAVCLRCRIDFADQIALLHLLPEFDMQVFQLPRNLGSHIDQTGGLEDGASDNRFFDGPLNNRHDDFFLIIRLGENRPRRGPAYHQNCDDGANDETILSGDFAFHCRLTHGVAAC